MALDTIQTKMKMKTIKEISVEHGIHRVTLNKAIDRGSLPARQSGNIWLVDDESDAFRKWLEAHWKHHRAEKKERK